MSKGLRAGILTIGNEVLDGLVLDTNAHWMEQQLVELGVEMRRVVSVRDEIEEIVSGLEFLSRHCDVVITSGGLGPTHDDMTLEAIASALHVPLELNSQGLAIVEKQYKMLFEKKIVSSSAITDTRRKMAILPKGAIALDNTVGGAPGVLITDNKTTIFCLPGVPSELKDIWKRGVEPWISENVKGAYYQEIVEFEVVDESVFAPYIEEAMMKNRGVWIKSMPKRYGTTRIMRVWISAWGKEIAEVKQKVKIAITTLERVSGLHSIPSDTNEE